MALRRVMHDGAAELRRQERAREIRDMNLAAMEQRRLCVAAQTRPDGATTGAPIKMGFQSA